MHTPGPWIASFDLNTHTGRESGWTVGPTGKEVAALNPTHATTAFEDAQLIAAAPDLLKAAERALPWLGKMLADKGHMHSVAPADCVGAAHDLHAAILKAAGKTLTPEQIQGYQDDRDETGKGETQK